jgi:hypothetical protein
MKFPEVEIQGRGPFTAAMRREAIFAQGDGVGVGVGVGQAAGVVVTVS